MPAKLKTFIKFFNKKNGYFYEKLKKLDKTINYIHRVFDFNVFSFMSSK